MRVRAIIFHLSHWLFQCFQRPCCGIDLQFTKYAIWPRIDRMFLFPRSLTVAMIVCFFLLFTPQKSMATFSMRKKFPNEVYGLKNCLKKPCSKVSFDELFLSSANKMDYNINQKQQNLTKI